MTDQARRPHGSGSAKIEVDGVLETCLYARDLEAAQRFYSKVIGLEIHSPNNGRDVFFRCGNGMLLIFDPRRTQMEGSATPSHGAMGAGHVAFAVREEVLDVWRERLLEHRVEIETETLWPGGGKSIYFRDPAGNSVELATPQIWASAAD